MKLPVFYKDLNIMQRKEVREEYVKRQAGKCYYCKGLLNEIPAKYIVSKKIDKNLFPNNFFKYPVHLHHDHNTGLTLGAVHCYCNAVLWQYEGE